MTGRSHPPHVAPPEAPPPGGRPEDVVTGFWLWAVALPLILAGYISDSATMPPSLPSAFVYVVTGLFIIVVATVVLTFLILMRAGYRWARSLLTVGALMTIMFTVSSLFTTNRPTAAALIYAGTGIVGAVLLAGGIVLLHRKDANAFFVK